MQTMTCADRFALLFSELVVGDVRLPNRIVSSGHDTELARDGHVTDELVAYHEARAAGGCGLIVAQVAGVHETARYTDHILMATDDSCIAGYARLAAAVHAHGTILFGQLFHPGREVIGSGDGTRRASVAPSAVPNERFRTMPRALSLREIEEIVQGYASAAARLVTAGLDGVEVVASHGYLPAQFLNPVTNLRGDRYGGSDQNRRRFLIDVLTAVRSAVPHGALGLRVSLDEREPYGMDIDEVLKILEGICAAGLVDYISVTTGTSATRAGSDHIAPDMSFASGYVAPLSARLRALVHVPVMVAGRINQPQDAERILQEGSADACVMTRALICDPELPRLAAAGAIDDIRACVGCDQACIGHFQMGVPISCIQHPETGRELQIRHHRVSTSQNVLVIGAGPAGLKAAAVLAAHGDHVDLYESRPRVGGQVLLAGMLPGRDEFAGVADNLLREVQRSGASIHLGVRLSLEDVVGHGYDRVIVATGASAYVPPLEILGNPVLAHHEDVLAGQQFSPGHILVADFAADWVGAGVARVLRARGHRVTLSMSAIAPGASLPQYVQDQQIRELLADRVEILALTRVFGADDDTAYLQHVLTGEHLEVSPVTAVVFTGWRHSRTSLADQLRESGLEVECIGDALAPRTAEEAVLEGFHLVR